MPSDRPIHLPLPSLTPAYSQGHDWIAELMDINSPHADASQVIPIVRVKPLLQDWIDEAPAQERAVREKAMTRILTALFENRPKLDLRNLGLSDLPKDFGLFDWHHLNGLDLSGNGLLEMPDRLDGLSALTWMDLSENLLTELPPGMAALTRLEKFYAEENNFPEFPLCLTALDKLDDLSLASCHLQNIPDEIRRMSHLRELDVSNNRLRSLPDAICALKLDTGYFNENYISAPPQGFERWLEELHAQHGDNLFLDFRDNEINLPDHLENLSRRYPGTISVDNYDDVDDIDEENMEAEQEAAAITQAHAAAPLHNSVELWRPQGASATCASSDWQRFEGEPAAGSFSAFLERLHQGLPAHATPQAEAMQRRVTAVLQSLQFSPGLRGVAFNLAQEALGACSDRVEMGLHEIESAIKLQASKGLSRERIGQLCISEFRKQELMKIGTELAVAKGSGREALEFHMLLLIELKERLELDSQMTSMKFARYPDLSKSDIKKAGRRVMDMDGSPEMIQFIAGHDSWKEVVRRTCRAELEMIDEWAVAELDLASNFSEGRYLRMSGQISADREKKISEVHAREAENFLNTGKEPHRQ